MLLLDGHTSTVYALAFSPDGRLLATGAKDGAVYLWDEGLDRRDLSVGLLGLFGPANGLDFLPAGDRLAVAFGKQGWAVKATATGLDQTLMPGHGATAVRVLAPDLLAVGTGNRAKPEAGRFEVWDLAAGRRKEPGFTAPEGVRAVAAHPPSRRVAWAEWGRRLSAWDLVKPDPVWFNLPRSSPAVAFHPDGTLLAAAQEWGAAVFDLSKPTDRLGGHGRAPRYQVRQKGTVTSVAFSPDGRTLATGGWDGTVRLWDAGTGAERAAFEWPVGKVFALAYSPDGLRLAAGGDAGKVMVWDAD